MVVDPKTGAILALASSPRYDPAQLGAQWKALNADADRPLLNRPTQGLYPPGSAFKPVVAARAWPRVRSRRTRVSTTPAPTRRGATWCATTATSPTASTPSPRRGSVDQHHLRQARGASWGRPPSPIRRVRSASSRDLPGRLSAVRSRFPDPAKMDIAHVAQASFGQGEVLATPLEMALVAASGIANGGPDHGPLSRRARCATTSRRCSRQTQPREWLQATDPATAATVRDLMVQRGHRGYGQEGRHRRRAGRGQDRHRGAGQGRAARLVHRIRAGDDPRVAVAVIVENGGTGGSVAAPLAAQVMRAALQR